MSEFCENPAGNKDTSNMQQSQQQPCRPGSANKESTIHFIGNTMHWFAMVGEDAIDSPTETELSIEDLVNLDHSLTQKEREERIKQLKDKQNEERQRKLEELKAQALATQKFREQKDEERRRRIDELKMRDTDKRQQVEDRKKAIWEAEKERREYILRKNQERDQRLESKRKNERSQIAFAFGSSTPRMMDTESGANWAHRSISSLTRRSSVRELNDGTAKKRAISASGLDRQSEAQKRMSTSMHEVFHWGRNTSAAPKKLSLSVAGSQIDFEGPPSPRRHTPASQYSARNRHSMVMVNSKQDDSCESSFYQTYNVHRRKTDLMPTIPSPRDTTRSSLGNHTPRTPGLRSGEITPKSLSASRPGSAMSTSTANSGLVTKRPTTSQRKARPISIAVTGVSKDEKPLAPLSANKPIKRTPSAPSTRTSETIKNRPSSAKATPGATPKSNTPAILSPSTEVAPKIVTNIKEPEPVQDDSIKNEKTIINNVIKAEQQHTEESINGGDIQVSASSMESKEVAFEVVETIVNTTIEESKLEKPIADVPVVEEIVESQPSIPKQEIALEPQAAPQKEIIPVTQSIPEPTENPEMTSSMMSKSRITTEEEAKAAIAERRRLAREEAERQAEIERKRLEAEEEAEYQRQLEEEERQREFELETIRLAEEQKRLEAERLEQAIEDNLKREEAEKQRLEEEARLKVEREIAERKAREDAEKLKIETAERLRKEEKEREERRKRVEAIMARTRKGGSTNTPSKNDGDGVDMTKSQIDSMSQSIIEQTLDSEQSTADQSSQQVPSPNDYEQSVTEKENLLMSSFNKMNLNLNGNGLNNNLLEANNNFNLLSNGQQNGKSDVSTDLIIDANATTNGLNSIDSAFKSTIEAPSDVTQKSQDQLIDFGSDATTTALSDDAIINVNNNFIDNSNSSLMTHNNLNNNNNNNLTMLVAASEHDNDDRDLSLL